MRPQRPLEWWISVIRLGAVPLAVLQVALTAGIPSRDRPVAWSATVLLAVGGVLLFALSRREEVDPNRIGGFGLSMGAYVLTQAAALDKRLRAVT